LYRSSIIGFSVEREGRMPAINRDVRPRALAVPAVDGHTVQVTSTGQCAMLTTPIVTLPSATRPAPVRA